MDTLQYKNYTVEIPADIVDIVRRRNRKRIITFVILFAAVVALLIYAWHLPKRLLPNYITFGIVFLILPFEISGVPVRLLDKSCCGEIVELKYKTHMMITHFNHGYGRWFELNVVYAKIRLDNGKIVRKPVYRERVGRKGSLLDVLQEGDVVVYIGGMYCAQRVSDDDRKDNFCVCCGALRPSKEEKCGNCGRTLSFKVHRKHEDSDVWWFDSKSEF